MDLFEDEHPKNLYVIRRKLGRLKKPPGYGDWQYDAGHFSFSILPAFDENRNDTDCILDLKHVDINITERDKNGNGAFVSLRDDPRFKDYKPILYDVITTPNGTINVGNGHNMPIPILLELIKYCHRLSDLTAFA